MRFQHRFEENRKNLLMLIIENIKSVDEQYGPLFGRQILLSKSCLFVPRLPWPDRHFSLSIESTLCGLLVFVLFFCGPACIAQSKFSVFLTRPRNRPPFDLPGLWLTCRNFFFSGIREAFHSPQCNYVLDCVRRRGRLRLAAVQSGDQVPAARPRVQMRLRCHGARPSRSAADFDQKAGESKALRGARMQVSMTRAVIDGHFLSSAAAAYLVGKLVWIIKKKLIC